MAKNIDQQLEAFRDQMRGTVLTSKNEHYDRTREVWNSFFDKHPAVIARCTDSDDVITAVNFAREHDMSLSVRSGGHDYAGNSASDEGLLIDLSSMNAIQVNPEEKTARVQAGATWGDVDHESQAFGLATVGVTVSIVGVAGSTLGGGSGYLSRKYGLAADNLISADIVTADGKLVHASEDQNPDLFWAIRGGGGNFGIAVSFEFQLHEVGPEVMSAQIFHPYEDVREVLNFYRDFMEDAPNEVQCYAFIIPTPPSEPFPEQMHGKPIVALIACHAGEREEGEKLFRELQNFGNPVLNVVQPIPYTQMQKAFDEGMPKGLRWYSKAHDFNELTDEVIDQIIKHTQNFKGAYTMAYLGGSDGAINKVDTDATAFPHRNTAFDFHILAGWDNAEQDDEIITWTKKFHHSLDKYATGGVYVNLLGHDEKERVNDAYGANYERLRKVKHKWDPENLFSNNHNIPPTG